ncbi:MAG: hypothetical protein P8Y44_05760 [Acidobacteriota bacterium]
MSDLRHRWLVFAVATLLGRLPASAVDYVEYYKVGLSASENGEWEQAIEMMRRAIEIQHEAKVRVKKALYFKRYLPHYYLGRALFESGDCEGALASWAESESQDIVTRYPEYERLRIDREACLQLQAQAEHFFESAKDTVASAGASAIEARRRLADLQATGTSGAASLSERLARAETDLRDAEILLRGGRDVDDLRLAVTSAARAREGFDSVAREASQWLKSVVSDEVRTRAELVRLQSEATESIARSEFLRPFPKGVATRRSRVESLVERVENLQQVVSIPDLRQLASQLEQAIADLDAAIIMPPKELSTAAEAYLAGRYSQVLEILSDTDFSSDRVMAHAHLLQAAALYSLSYSQTEPDPELLAMAREEIRSCRSLDNEISAQSTAVFSPRFIEFFHSQRPLKTEAQGHPEGP